MNSTTEFRTAETEVSMPWDRLAGYLTEQGHRLSPARPRQFAGGMGNLNYLIELDGCPAVLRRPPPGPIPPGANDMRREHRVLSRLWEKLPLAPRSFHYCPDPEIIGAHFLIMEYRPGRAVRGDVLPPPLADDPAAGRRLSETLIGILADLHAVDPDEIGLGDFGRPEGFLGRAITGWIKRNDIATDGHPSTVARAVGDWLLARPCPEGAVSLLHNDFKLDNLLLDAETMQRPVVVLDWDQSTRGDPLFDLATLLSYWTEPGDPPAMHALAQMPTARPGFLSRDQAAALYARRTGRDLSDFPFHRVLGLFKLAVVFVQLHAQYRRGTVTDEKYAAFAPMAEELFVFAHDVAHGRLS